MSTGTMMEAPLTLDVLVRRIQQHAHVEVVSRLPDKSLHRTTWGQVGVRAERLARALVQAGIAPGDRVATLMWNHAQHLEAYLGVPLSGAVLHPLNLRLHADEVAYIANDARDRVLLVDEVLVKMADQVRAAGATFERVIVVGGEKDEYEAFLATAKDDTKLPTLREDDACSSCYTSGTTGKPKGVVYTHRSILLHSLVSALPDALCLSRGDTLMPVTPMFHVNAWGLPYTAALVGAKLVFPGPALDPASLVSLLESEQVTVSAGVPTLWIGIRDLLDATPNKPKLVPGLRMIVGGSAAPQQLIRDFDRLGMKLLHAWGMTETSPIGTVSRVPPELEKTLSEDELYTMRGTQGVPVPLVELVVRNEQGDVPHDDKTTGEVLIRGPWIAGSYFHVDAKERWTSDGYFRTGDVARVDRHGFMQLTDRIADLIKSGGEWISTQELEGALMAHPSVKEAAVIGVAHPKWIERPLAIVVLREGRTATTAELRDYLAPKFSKISLPDAVEVVGAIPRTSTGKFLKTALREQYKGYRWPA